MKTIKDLNRLKFTMKRNAENKGNSISNVEYISLYLYINQNQPGTLVREVQKALCSWRGYPHLARQKGNLAYSSYFRGETYSGEPVPIASIWMERFWGEVASSSGRRICLTTDGWKLVQSVLARLGWSE